MEARAVTPDIMVLRDMEERAILVRGNEYATAIGVPPNKEVVDRLLAASREVAGGALNLAILTRHPSGFETGVRDRAGQPDWPFDDAPQSPLGRRIRVRRIRDAETVYDDTGRAFHCEACEGRGAALAVHIEPDNVLVVDDDLRPDMPPEVVPGAVADAIRRYEVWRASAPQVIVPASGIPIAGDEAMRMLDRSVEYLRSLREQVHVQMTGNRFPWERLVHTLPCCRFWTACEASPTLAKRHRYNVREMAADVMLAFQPDAGIAYLAA